MGPAQGVQHHEVVDDAPVADGGVGDAGLAQPGRVGLALVAQDVRLARDDQRRRQTGELLPLAIGEAMGLTPGQDALAKQLLRLITADVANG